MKDVKIDFRFNHNEKSFSQGLCVWTTETRTYDYYPISYSIQECLEIVCERLGWEFIRYKKTAFGRGFLYTRKPLPKKLSTMEWWGGTNFTATDGVVT